MREGPWATSQRSEGVSFFANGELLKKHSVSDLIFASWAMPHSVSHFSWRKKTSVEDEALTYHLVTLHGERLVFDARTGDITSSYSPPEWTLVALIVSLVAFAAIRRSRGKRGKV